MFPSKLNLLTLALLVLTAAASQAHAQGVCSLQAKEVASLDDVLKCVRSVPFSEEVRTATLDTMRRTFPLYAFFDIVRDSPDPVHFPMQVDLEQELDRIGRQVCVCVCVCVCMCVCACVCVCVLV
jgi:hypothetical protein